MILIYLEFVLYQLVLIKITNFLTVGPNQYIYIFSVMTEEEH